MTSTTWSPTQYLKFASERSRPFVELLNRVPVQNPSLVVDLGCGPASGEEALFKVWPQAQLIGVDSSQEMIERAKLNSTHPRASYLHQDVRRWLQETAPGIKPDVIVSNAMLQWVEGHLDLLPQIADTLAEGGAFAMQVPGNFTAPSHVLLREIANRQPYRQYVKESMRDTVIGADRYLEVLSRPGWSVDAWETTYLHILQGEDPIFEWNSATGARPVLNSLPADLKTEFSWQYKQALRQAYPAQDFGTVLPLRRIFAVAVRS